MVKRFLKDSILYTCSTLLGRIVHLAILPLYSRCLPEGDLGRYDLLSGIYVSFAILLTLNISTGQAREIGSANNEQERNSYTIAAFWFCIAMFSVSFLVIQIFGKLFNFEGTSFAFIGKGNILSITFIITVLMGIQDVVINHLRWSLQPKKVLLLTGVNALALVIVSVVTVFYLRLKLEGALLAQAAGLAVTVTLGFRYLGINLFVRPSLSLCKRMLTFSLPAVPAGLGLIALQYSSRISINDQMSPFDLDEYAAASRLAVFIAPILSGFQQSLVPLITHNAEDPALNSQLSRIFRAYFGLGGAFVLCMGIAAPVFVAVFASSEFLRAPLLLAPLTFALMVYSANIFAPGLWIKRASKSLAFCYLFTATVNILVAPIAGEHWGLAGVAIATVGSQVIGLTLVFLISHRLMPLRYPWRKVLSLLITLFLCLAFVGYLQIYKTTIWVACGGTLTLLIYSFFSVKFGVVSVSEIYQLIPDRYRKYMVLK